MSAHDATWRDSANRVLLKLFANGYQPTKQEIYDAYPFNFRQYWPYKVWLEQVKWWKAGCPQRPAKPRKIEPIPEGQEALL